MDKIHFVNIQVQCQQNLLNTYSMQLRALQMEDGTLLYAPCNGCEQFDGSPACKRCICEIDRQFLNENPNIHSPISTIK